MDAFNPHLPKQAKPLVQGTAKVTTYETTGGFVTSQLAAHNLSLVPTSSIPSSSLIHDNASGAGNLSRELLSTHPDPSSLKIYATDNDQVFLDVLKSDAEKNSWPITVSNQNSLKTDFEDEFFDYSFTNTGIFLMGDGEGGAREIYRTLKPGGTAVLNCWHQVTWFLPIKSVHDRFRPGKPYPAPVINWNDGEQLKKVTLAAGFKEENMKIDNSEAWAKFPEGEFRNWVEKAWAYLGGIGTWQEDDEKNWDAEVDLLVELLLKMPTTFVENGEVRMRASQWIVVAKK